MAKFVVVCGFWYYTNINTFDAIDSKKKPK